MVQLNLVNRITFSIGVRPAACLIEYCVLAHKVPTSAIGRVKPKFEYAGMWSGRNCDNKDIYREKSAYKATNSNIG
jgi:hypothetical protein